MKVVYDIVQEIYMVSVKVKFFSAVFLYCPKTGEGELLSSHCFSYVELIKSHVIAECSPKCP